MKKKNKTLNDINNESEIVKNIEFLSWVQEFSKKIVFLTFLLFLISNLFVLIVMIIQLIQTNDITSIDTYISEIHLTFREIIGGYLLKAAFENVIKIGGNYLHSYLKSKLPNVSIEEENEEYE